MRLALAALVAVVACDRRAAVTSCDDDLHGVWVNESGARWMLLDNGPTLEGYPLFDDSATGAAPRVIDLRRGERFTGEVKRRFMRGGDECVATAPIRVAKCKANSLQIVVADPAAPLGFAPCAWGKPNESTLDHWRRE